MKIGFFDSGIGGLSVLKEAIRILPNEEYLYYADSLNAPYGTKTREETRKCIFNAVDFIAKKNVKALVVACNTATIVAINDLRSMYDFPILGMEPAVKPAVEGNGHKRVLVTATPLALAGEKFHDLVAKVDSEGIVDLLPLPELVEYAENFIFDESIITDYLQRKLSGFDLKQYGSIVLGCTHFPLFRNVFRKVLPGNIEIIDGSYGTVKHLKNILGDKGLLAKEPGKDEIEFYISGDKVTDEAILKKYMELLKE